MGVVEGLRNRGSRDEGPCCYTLRWAAGNGLGPFAEVARKLTGEIGIGPRRPAGRLPKGRVTRHGDRRPATQAPLTQAVFVRRRRGCIVVAVHVQPGPCRDHHDTVWVQCRCWAPRIVTAGRACDPKAHVAPTVPAVAAAHQDHLVVYDAPIGRIQGPVAVTRDRKLSLRKRTRSGDCRDVVAAGVDALGARSGDGIESVDQPLDARVVGGLDPRCVERTVKHGQIRVAVRGGQVSLVGAVVGVVDVGVNVELDQRKLSPFAVAAELKIPISVAGGGAVIDLHPQQQQRTSAHVTHSHPADGVTVAAGGRVDIERLGQYVLADQGPRAAVVGGAVNVDLRLLGAGVFNDVRHQHRATLDGANRGVVAVLDTGRRVADRARNVDLGNRVVAVCVDAEDIGLDVVVCHSGL